MNTRLFLGDPIYRELGFPLEKTVYWSIDWLEEDYDAK
jgi:hypothetical protein